MRENVKRIGRRSSVAVLTAVAMLATYAVPAWATSTDPTGGAAAQVQTGLTAWITTYGAPMFAALLVLGLIFTVLFKFAKRSGKAAGG